MCSVHRSAPEGPMMYACAQSGCQVCIERLLAPRRPGALGHSSRLSQRLPYGELLHKGQVAVWQAIRHYDAGRGVAFSTYAVPAIQPSALGRRGAGAATAGLSSADGGGGSGGRGREAWQRQAVRTALEELLAFLPESSYHIIVAAYGLDGQPPLSLAAIGRLYDLSREGCPIPH